MWVLFYAKLIGQIIQHWLIIATCWHFPDRSIFKAALAIRSCATQLLLVTIKNSMDMLQTVIDMLAQSVKLTCRISKRRSKLASFQLIEFDSA